MRFNAEVWLKKDRTPMPGKTSKPNEPSMTLPANSIRMLLAEKLVREERPGLFLESDLFRRSGMSFESELFFIAQIDIVDFAAQTKKLRIPDGADPIQWLVHNILGATANVFSDHFFAYPFLANGEYYMLLNLKHASTDNETAGDGSEYKGTIFALCEAARDNIFEAFGLSIRFCISLPSRGIDMLNQTYRLLKEMSRSDLFERDKWEDSVRDIVRFSLDIVNKSAGSKRIFNEKRRLEQQFLSACTKPNIDALYDILCRIVDLEKTDPAAAVSTRSRMRSRIEILYSRMGFPACYKKVYGEGVLSVVDAMDSIEESVTLDDMKDRLRSIFEDIEANLHPSNIPFSFRVEEIADYVFENHADPNLSAERIGKAFGVSLPYLSRIFKEKQGIKLIDYIHKVRIEASKAHLAQDSDTTIEQIALAVGYYNPLTFTRAFKRIEGIPPGLYRKSVRF